MKRYVLWGVVVVFAAGTLAGGADAQDHYQVTMTGTVAKVNDPGNDLVIQVNDTWTVVYVFDPHTQDDVPIDPYRGEYAAIESISLAIGPCDPMTLIPRSIVVYNNVDLGDTYNIVADMPIDPFDPCIYADLPQDPMHVPMILDLQDSTGTCMGSWGRSA